VQVGGEPEKLFLAVPREVASAMTRPRLITICHSTEVNLIYLPLEVWRSAPINQHCSANVLRPNCLRVQAAPHAPMFEFLQSQRRNLNAAFLTGRAGQYDQNVPAGIAFLYAHAIAASTFGLLWPPNTVRTETFRPTSRNVCQTMR